MLMVMVQSPTSTGSVSPFCLAQYTSSPCALTLVFGKWSTVTSSPSWLWEMERFSGVMCEVGLKASRWWIMNSPKQAMEKHVVRHAKTTSWGPRGVSRFNLCFTAIINSGVYQGGPRIWILDLGVIYKPLKKFTTWAKNCSLGSHFHSGLLFRCSNAKPRVL